MKVQQLIDILKDKDPNTDVVCWYVEEGEFLPVTKPSNNKDILDD